MGSNIVLNSDQNHLFFGNRLMDLRVKSLYLIVEVSAGQEIVCFKDPPPKSVCVIVAPLPSRRYNFKKFISRTSFTY